MHESLNPQHSKHRLAVGLVVACYLAPSLFAHPGTHKQLTQLNARLRKDPDNAELLLRRGEAHRIHRDWKAAETDYSRARELAPALAWVDLCRGRMLLEADRPQEALGFFERFLVAQADHVEARVFYARALSAVGRRKEAAVEYTRALDVARRPLPEYYIERTKVLTEIGEVSAALRGLDEGVERLGRPIALELHAIGLERERGDYDAALGRVERIAATSTNKPRWLAERGDILVAAGRWEEGLDAYRSTLVTIDTLPAKRRRLPLFQALRERAASSIERAMMEYSKLRQRRVVVASVVGCTVFFCGVFGCLMLLRRRRSRRDPRAGGADLPEGSRGLTDS